MNPAYPEEMDSKEYNMDNTVASQMEAYLPKNIYSLLIRIREEEAYQTEQYVYMKRHNILRIFH